MAFNIKDRMKKLKSSPSLIYESKIRDSSTDGVLWKSKVICNEERIADVFASTIEFSGFNNKKILNLVNKKLHSRSNEEISNMSNYIKEKLENDKNKAKEYFSKK